jgi:hypothetical protein
METAKMIKCGFHADDQCFCPALASVIFDHAAV